MIKEGMGEGESGRRVFMSKKKREEKRESPTHNRAVRHRHTFHTIQCELLLGVESLTLVPGDVRKQQVFDAISNLVERCLSFDDFNDSTQRESFGFGPHVSQGFQIADPVLEDFERGGSAGEKLFDARPRDVLRIDGEDGSHDEAWDGPRGV